MHQSWSSIWKTMSLFLIISMDTSTSSSEECMATVSLQYNTCTHNGPQDTPGWDSKSMCRKFRDVENNGSTCRNKRQCKNLRLSIFTQQLYSITLKNTFLQMLSRCCGACATCYMWHIQHDTADFNLDILNNSDVIFPVVAKSDSKKRLGFYFFPLFSVPSAYYFTMKRSGRHVTMEVLYACARMWPLLIICFLFTLGSGCVIWFVEKRKNSEDFSRSLLPGCFEGFWVSWISMTTVGYGDKVPKSYLGRVYAILMILVGLTICSMFTAELTNEIMKQSHISYTTMRGKDIAVLKGRLHDMTLVTSHGGIAQAGTIDDTMEGIEQLFNMLHNRTVDGFLVDRNTYHHFSQTVKDAKQTYMFQRLRRMRENIIQTEKFPKGVEPLSSGFLFREFDVYVYFKSFLENNHLELLTCNSLRLNTKDRDAVRYPNVFRAPIQFPDQTMFYFASVLGLLICVCTLVRMRTGLIGIRINSIFQCCSYYIGMYSKMLMNRIFQKQNKGRQYGYNDSDIDSGAPLL